MTKQRSLHNVKHDTDIHLLLERGRRIAIRSGGNEWEAVYWGSDENGDIVAHRSGEHWWFVHFDVRGAANKMVVGNLLSQAEILDIERDVVKTMGVKSDDSAPRKPAQSVKAAPAASRA